MEAINAINGYQPREALSAQETSMVGLKPQESIFTENRRTQNPSEAKSSDTKVQASEETIKKIAEAMDKYIRSMENDLEIKIHEETGTILVKVISHETGEVIREIPPEELIELAAKMEEMTGVLLQKMV